MQTRAQIREEIKRLQKLLKRMRQEGIDPPRDNMFLVACQMKLGEYGHGKRFSLVDILKIMGRENNYANRQEMFPILRSCGWEPLNSWVDGKTRRLWVKGAYIKESYKSAFDMYHPEGKKLYQVCEANQ